MIIYIFAHTVIHTHTHMQKVQLSLLLSFSFALYILRYISECTQQHTLIHTRTYSMYFTHSHGRSTLVHTDCAALFAAFVYPTVRLATVHLCMCLGLVCLPRCSSLATTTRAKSKKKYIKRNNNKHNRQGNNLFIARTNVHLQTPMHIYICMYTYIHMYMCMCVHLFCNWSTAKLLLTVFGCISIHSSFSSSLFSMWWKNST